MQTKLTIRGGLVIDINGTVEESRVDPDQLCEALQGQRPHTDTYPGPRGALWQQE
jgi:hypothetical protein